MSMIDNLIGTKSSHIDSMRDVFEAEWLQQRPLCRPSDVHHGVLPHVSSHGNN